ncbi:hypothetical protein GQ42DRAFT_161241 [Ramicandelaber brevisporus]|nr:hypothetical protein GQ42DRAFT_161241 [Ramicandelaber brevisporus]
MRYIHVAFNLIMVSIAVFGVLYFGTMIINDIKIKTESQSSNILAEISICRQEYSKNRCDPPNLRLPALEPKCIEWEICMNRDHNDVTRARLSAETFAEILNSFVDPISTKSMAFIFAFYFGVTILGNLVLNWNTGRSHPNNGPQQQPVPHPPVNPYNGGGGGSSGVTSNDGSMPTPYYQQPPPQYQYQHPEPPPLTPFHMPVYRGPVSAAATPMTTATANRPNPFMRRNDFSAKTPIPPPRFGATANNAGGGNGNGGGAMFGGDIQRSESPVPGSFMSSTNSLFGVKSAKKLR